MIFCGLAVVAGSVCGEEGSEYFRENILYRCGKAQVYIAGKKAVASARPQHTHRSLFYKTLLAKDACVKKKIACG